MAFLGGNDYQSLPVYGLELPRMLHELVLTVWLLGHDYSIDLFSFMVFVRMVRVCQVLDSTVALLLLLHLV